MAAQIVGIASHEGANTNPNNPEHFELPLPADIQEGDLVVVAELSYPDTIMDISGDYPAIYLEMSLTAWNRAVWAGPWTGRRLPSGAPAPIAMQGSGFNNAVGQFYRAQLIVLRNAVPDYERTALASYPWTPALPFTGPAVSVAFGRGGLGGFSGNPWRNTSWSRVELPVASRYVCTDMALHPGPQQLAEEAQHVGDGSVWEFFALGINTTEPSRRAAPLRVHPRDDELGPGTGRSWPPPTSWQSGRRYGGGAIR